MILYIMLFRNTERYVNYKIFKKTCMYTDHDTELVVLYSILSGTMKRVIQSTEQPFYNAIIAVNHVKTGQYSENSILIQRVRQSEVSVTFVLFQSKKIFFGNYVDALDRYIEKHNH